MTSYPSQASFPPLAQSTVYSSFPQGQTYGLPPFGQSSLLSRSLSPVRSLSATRHQHLRNFCSTALTAIGSHSLGFPATDGRPHPLLTPPRLGRHSPPVATAFFFSSSASLCSPFFIHFFHLQVLCGQALKLRPGCPRRPLVVSLGFSASALHTLRASKAICTTHIPTKASCDLTLPHRITPPSSAPFIPLFVHCRGALSCFIFLFLVAATTVLAERLLCLQARASQRLVCTQASFQPQPPPRLPPQWLNR